MEKTFLKSDKSNKINVGPSESMSKSKKNTIDPEKIIKFMELMLLDYLFYQIALQKKMCSGQIQECWPLISLFKNYFYKMKRLNL